MDTKNTCKNCKHFYKHYVINSHGNLVEINIGHCGLPFYHNKYLSDDNEACKHWEDATDKAVKTEQNIRKSLLKMAKRIEDIALILEDE